MAEVYTLEARAKRPVDEPPWRAQYRVREGDSLWSVAARLLSDGGRWEEVYRANRDMLLAANLGSGAPKYTLRAGMLLEMPPYERDEEEA